MKTDIKNYTTKYFGTDGFRGEVNVNLTSLNAYKVGRFLGWYYKSHLYGCNKENYRPKIVVGKDTRRSSYMLEYSLVAGITASGADAYLLHVTTTPSVSFITKQDGFDAGIMITASHNPYYDNGIKIINKKGEKLDDLTTYYVEQYLDGNFESIGVLEEDLPLAKKDKIGFIVDYVAGRNRYLGYLISLASNSYKNLRIGLDCANGASWKLAKGVFQALGAQVYVIGAEPNGLNVNEECGSTHIQNLCELVKEKQLDIGFAFDGDADRCIAVDENGSVVDGDKILYLLAKRLKRLNNLNGDTIVTTVMSNSGLEKCLNEIQIKCVQTKVGDRFVYECIKQSDYCLGGEQSGHIILKKYATTGDGILTAIMITEEICDQKLNLSKLVSKVVLYPQHVKSIKVISKSAVTSDEEIIKAVNNVKKELCGGGRILLRESGTEPVIRIMIECESLSLAKKYANSLADLIKERGHTVE
ncbi:MAG: phosphoglucosamine mutase [Clostridia bacterium]|nr:phosphoglucosamine mutase [Clostridia bacterium]